MIRTYLRVVSMVLTLEAILPECFSVPIVTTPNVGLPLPVQFPQRHEYPHSARQPLLSSYSPFRELKTSAIGITTEGPLEVVVELAIICDLEFSKMFQFDRQQILNYWKVFLWNLNLRFASLPSTTISFHATSLTIINNTIDQPFIETNRDTKGTEIITQILYSFSEWINQNTARYPHFDVPLLATGFKEETDYAIQSWLKNPCSQSDERHHLGSVVLYQSNKGWNRLTYVAARLAELLGAENSNGTGSHCTERDHILSNQIDEKSYFFSRCADKTIAEFLRSPDASCLRRQGGVILPEFLDHDEAKVVPSIREQCVFVNNNPNADTIWKEESCHITKCYERIAGQFVQINPVFPAEDTPCGDDKRCFRGRCLGRGFRVKNVGTDKCLLGSNRFSYNDLAILGPCPGKPTALDQFVIQDIGDWGKFLAVPYSTIDTYENEDKCLTTNDAEGNVQFQRCSTYHQFSWYGWDLIQAGPTNDNEFLLYHRRTKKCVKATGLNLVDVVLDSSCNPTNKLMLWSFYEPILPNITTLYTTGKSINSVQCQQEDQHAIPSFVYGFITCLLIFVSIGITYIIALKFLQRTNYPVTPILFTAER